MLTMLSDQQLLQTTDAWDKQEQQNMHSFAELSTIDCISLQRLNGILMSSCDHSSYSGYLQLIASACRVKSSGFCLVSTGRVDLIKAFVTLNVANIWILHL